MDLPRSRCFAKTLSRGQRSCLSWPLSVVSWSFSVWFTSSWPSLPTMLTSGTYDKHVHTSSSFKRHYFQGPRQVHGSARDSRSHLWIYDDHGSRSLQIRKKQDKKTHFHLITPSSKILKHDKHSSVHSLALFTCTTPQFIISRCVLRKI